MEAFVTAGAAFLLAVLWFDLMFDVQARRPPDGEVPEPVLASIAAYYRRVTTTARPMNQLVAVTMVLTLGVLVAEIIGDDVTAWVAWTSFIALTGAVALAAVRTVPSAVRLGSRADPLHEQSQLARALLRQHLVCFALAIVVLALQLGSAADRLGH